MSDGYSTDKILGLGEVLARLMQTQLSNSHDGITISPALAVGMTVVGVIHACVEDPEWAKKIVKDTSNMQVVKTGGVDYNTAMQTLKSLLWK